MKLVAHRGWSAGPAENTISAFRQAISAPDVDGVEFDVRRASDGRLVVSHDPPDDEAPNLAAIAEYIAGSRLKAFVELKEGALVKDVTQVLVAAGLSGRALLFGPPEFIEGMDRESPIALGVIVDYPWRISRIADALAPDVILTGWDYRYWTRLAFRAWWSIFSLHRIGRRHAAGIVVGIVGREADLRWLRRQGIDAAVIDMKRLPRESVG